MVILSQRKSERVGRKVHEELQEKHQPVSKRRNEQPIHQLEESEILIVIDAQYKNSSHKMTMMKT